MIRMVTDRSRFARRVVFSGFLVLATTWTVVVSPVSADQRFVVRTIGLPALNLGCFVARCTVQYALDGGVGRLFLVTTSDAVNPQTFLTSLLSQFGILDAEADYRVRTLGADAEAAPPGLYDRAIVDYYGSGVWHGYVAQPDVGAHLLEYPSAVDVRHHEVQDDDRGMAEFELEQAFQPIPRADYFVILHLQHDFEEPANRIVILDDEHEWLPAHTASPLTASNWGPAMREVRPHSRRPRVSARRPIPA